jgi:hypothetical protein
VFLRLGKAGAGCNDEGAGKECAFEQFAYHQGDPLNSVAAHFAGDDNDEMPPSETGS